MHPRPLRCRIRFLHQIAPPLDESVGSVAQSGDHNHSVHSGGIFLRRLGAGVGTGHLRWRRDARARPASRETGGTDGHERSERLPVPGEGRRLGGGAIASLIGVGLLVIFMIQNTEDVRLDFLVWHFTWPLWLLTIASAALGALVWFGFGVIRRHRRRRERRDDRRD